MDDVTHNNINNNTLIITITTKTYILAQWCIVNYIKILIKLW